MAPSTLPALVLLLLGTGAHAEAPVHELSVCDDGSEWPPYTYYLRDGEGRSTGVLTGFAVDVLQAIAQRDGVTVRLTLLPWARCQMEVEHGRNFQMALNASYSDERERKYLLTQAYYSTTHYYFYSRRHARDGWPIHSLDDLARLQVCGVRGYNYAAYRLPPERLDMGARDFASVVTKLHAERCQVAVEKLEVVAGYRVTGKDLLADPDLGRAPIPGMPKGEFHMLVSRQHPQGAALRAWLDTGLKRLRDSGELQQLQRRYLP